MKLIILDMDGVINRDSDDYIKTEQEMGGHPRQSAGNSAA